MRFLMPLGIFVALVAFLAVGLGLKPREVPSPLIGKPAPHFSLAVLHEPSKLAQPKDMLGKVWLLNVWATWCGACREEHPVLMDLARKGIVPIYGLDYKDNSMQALVLLRQMGNPYQVTAFDADGRVGIDYGVYGVPETYVIDQQGIIRYKLVGPVTQELLDNKILPLVKELQK